MINLTLVSKINIIDNVWSFNFNPSELINWTAGQFIEVKLPHDNTDVKGDTRYFTISSAPFEQFIQLTTRITDSSFKKALSDLDIGDLISIIEGPKGDFVWQESNMLVVFIIGGIGITPFISIIKQLVHDGKKINLTLIYANRTEDIPFREQIDDWAQNDTTLSVKYEVGTPLTIDRILQIYPEITKTMVYLSGPEPMVNALSGQLKVSGLLDNQIKSDYFINYTEKNY